MPTLRASRSGRWQNLVRKGIVTQFFTRIFCRFVAEGFSFYEVSKSTFPTYLLLGIRYNLGGIVPRRKE